MGNDAEQDFFNDGITEDIITDLSKVPGLLVLGRATVFAYKGKALSLERLVNELGAAYIVEGSVRRVGSKVRINAQLTEGASGGHLWADRYDRNIADVFDVLDEVTRSIVESISGKIGNPPLIERYRPTNLEAYDLVLRSRWQWTESTKACLEAQALLTRAIELDPNYPEAHWLIAQTQLFNWMVWNGSQIPHRKNAMVSAQRALKLAPNESWAHSVMAYVWLGELRWEESRIEFHHALELNPNDSDILLGVADYYIAICEPLKAMEYLVTSLRLNPYPSGAYFWELGEVQTSIGHFAEAVVTLRREETYNTASRRALVVALALLGDIEGAKKEAKLFLASNPHWTIGAWETAMPFKYPEQTKTWVDAFRLAGLPE
jgi:TolB-like protein/Tfp pilus assembly protein PilF